MINGGWELLLYNLSPFVNHFGNMAIFLFFSFLFFSCTFMCPTFFECLNLMCPYILLIAPCPFCKDTFGERGHNTSGALFVEWMDGTMLTLI
jgi:hypothetical protein